MSNALTIKKGNVVIHKKANNNNNNNKKGFYELEYLPKVKQLKELHQQLNYVPTIADIRDFFDCEVGKAEKLFKLYCGDDKHNTGSKIELPNFLLSSLNHAINIIVTERNNEIEQSNKNIAEKNEDVNNELRFLKQQNKNLQGELLDLQQKLNDANLKIKELNNDKLVEFLKSELEKLQTKYDEAVNVLFKTPKTKKTNANKAKTELPINTLEDLFK